MAESHALGIRIRCIMLIVEKINNLAPSNKIEPFLKDSSR